MAQDSPLQFQATPDDSGRTGELSDKSNSEAVGAVLSRPVLDKNGRVLLRKGEVLDHEKINLLKIHGIESVKIQGSVKPPAVPGGEISFSTVAGDSDFIQFTIVYNEKKEEARRLIRSISCGGLVDIDELASFTDDTMSHLTSKSDILSYLTFLDGTDDVTYGHSLNVSMLGNLFGHWLELNENALKELTVAALLHDVGKTQISQSIIGKPSTLTDEEYAVMKTHTTLGYQILKPQFIPEPMKLAALMHHEKIDGSGYPNGLTGDRISDLASIVAICDIYDAMTSNRSYRNKICPFTVIETFERKFYGDLNTKYLLLFLKNIAQTYRDSFCELSDGRSGKVVFIQLNNLSRPIVQINRTEFVDLAHQPDISIIRVT